MLPEARGLRRGAARRRRARQHRRRRDGGDAMSLHDRAEAAILPTYPERPLALVRGVGCTVWDEDGNAYLDLVGGLAVNSLGYGHPAAVQALAEQAAVLGHVSNLFYSEPMVALAERLCALSGQDRAFFCNSGAEAVEAAIKLARRAGAGARRARQARHRVRRGRLPRPHAGHARGRLVGRQARAVRARARRLPSTSPRNDLDALARRRRARDRAPCWSSRSRARAASGTIDAEWLAAGARALRSPRRAAALRRGADRHRPLRRLVLRTSCAGVRPDAIAVAKGLAGGLPIGALLATRSADAGFERGDHATTFGGSPADRRRGAGRARRDRARGAGRERPRGRRAHRRARRRPARRRPRARRRACCSGSSSPTHPRREVADALRARGILVNAITPDGAAPGAAAVPLAGRGRPFLCRVRGRAGRAPRPACHHSGISPKCARIPVLESCRKRPLTSSFSTYGERCRCLRSPTTPSATWLSLDTMGSRASRTSPRLTSMASRPQCSS